jgi:2-polyprenyl-3-methyl-5-hydroxy-6-metoxy-1,4-benzoquinol methylase
VEITRSKLASAYEVVGLDVTPALFEHARRHAADAGVELEWAEGDASAARSGASRLPPRWREPVLAALRE